MDPRAAEMVSLKCPCDLWVICYNLAHLVLGYWTGMKTRIRQGLPLRPLIALTFLLGCAQNPSPEFELSPIVCPATNRAQAFAAAQQALRLMYFTVDVADEQSGYIKTLPLSGAQAFEVWRSDSVGAFNATEANLHSLRRTAELQITEQDDEIEINCTVTTQRLNLPGRQVTSSAQAYRMHSDSARAIQKLKLTPEQERNMMWTDLGPDQRLAQRILERVGEQLTRAGILLNQQI